MMLWFVLGHVANRRRPRTTGSFTIETAEPLGGGVLRQRRASVSGDGDAEFGVFICLDAPTKPMLEAALEAGTWVSENDGRIYQRVQILSAQDLIDGKTVKMPASRTALFAEAAKEKQGKQGRLV